MRKNPRRIKVEALQDRVFSGLWYVAAEDIPAGSIVKTTKWGAKKAQSIPKQYGIAIAAAAKEELIPVLHYGYWHKVRKSTKEK